MLVIVFFLKTFKLAFLFSTLIHFSPVRNKSYRPSSVMAVSRQLDTVMHA